MHLPKRRLFGGVSVAVAVAGIASTAAAAFHSHSNTLDTQPVMATIVPTTSTTAAGGSGSGLTGSSNIVTFTAGDFVDDQTSFPSDSLFVGLRSNTPPNSASKSFGFTVASTDTNVTDVYLSIVNNGSTIAKSSTTGTGLQTSGIALTMSESGSDATSQAYTIGITDTNSILEAGYDSTALFFEVFWTRAGGSGSSCSRSFAFISDPGAAPVPTTLLAQFTNTAPVRSESYSTRATAASTGTIAATTTSTTQATNTNDNASLTGPAKSSSSSGLSKGAIAGIAIGAVAAIAIIGAIAFFLIRRRNNNSKKNAYNAGLLSGSVEPYRGAGPISDLGGPHTTMHDGMGSGTAVNLMEKDALAGGAGAAAGHFAVADREIGGPNTPHSPHSPYTDEDVSSTPQIIPSRNIGTSSGAGSAAVTPVVSPVVTQALPVAGGAAAATPPPVAPAPAPAAPAMRGQVAALIEDHMTPEDVARLEAEERELDADIENAIRNRAAASSRQG